jgi:hypothetical protein
MIDEGTVRGLDVLSRELWAYCAGDYRVNRNQRGFHTSLGHQTAGDFVRNRHEKWAWKSVER